MQFAQANPQTKNCKRACFTNSDKIVFKKFPNDFKKNKNTTTHSSTKTAYNDTKINIDNAYSDKTDRRPAGKSVYVAIAGAVVNRRSVLLRNFVLNGQESASNPLLHIHAKRCVQFYDNACPKLKTYETKKSSSYDLD